MSHTFPPDARDRVYTHCARAITEAGTDREALMLSRLALLMFEAVGDEARCHLAIEQALQDLPVPSMSSPAWSSPTTNGDKQ